MVDDRRSVRERVEDALEVLARDDPHLPIKIEALCKAANVNRSNLYANHRDLVERALRRNIRPPEPLARDRQKSERSSAIEQACQKIMDLEQRYRALLMICVEQQEEIRQLRYKNAEATSRKRASR